MRFVLAGRRFGPAFGPTNYETPGDLVSSREASGFSWSGMLPTPRPPSTAAEGALWLRERFEERAEAVVAGRRLGHFAGPDIRWGFLQAVAGVIEQRGQGKGLRCRDPLVACLVEAAVRIPDVRLDVAYVVDISADVHLDPARELDLFGLVQELRERQMRLEAVPVAGLEVLDVTFAVDAELDVEAAGFVAAYPRHASSGRPEHASARVREG